MTRSNALATLASVLIAALTVGLVFLTILVFELSGSVGRNQTRDTEALCALRADEQTRVSSGETFLIGHPKGIAGISAQTLQAGLVNEQRTLIALRPLVCPS